jgi:hypothetical protein
MALRKRYAFNGSSMVALHQDTQGIIREASRWRFLRT